LSFFLICQRLFLVSYASIPKVVYALDRGE
jgi:hypothetical protein